MRCGQLFWSCHYARRVEGRWDEIEVGLVELAGCRLLPLAREVISKMFPEIFTQRSDSWRCLATASGETVSRSANLLEDKELAPLEFFKRYLPSFNSFHCPMYLEYCHQERIRANFCRPYTYRLNHFPESWIFIF